MSYFFTSQMPADGILTGAIIDHLISTRIQPEQIINITDLNGSRWQVKLINLDKKLRQAKISFVEYEYIKQSIAYPSASNTLLQAQVDKAYLDKMFEILPFSQFDQIVLFKSQFSPNQVINQGRLDKILTRSLEQSEKIYKPKVIISDLKISQLIESDYSQNRLNLVLDTGVASSDGLPKSGNTSVWIGPEGGWSKDELELFGNLTNRDASNFEFTNLGSVIYPAWLCSLGIR
ncbi:MAG: RsmE family RNA methyltransferase [Candidatus Parcubacteria bacterium]|nr:RsmE family RNA methyltransferase [Candidatus Paceibacterota bacterium]